MAASVVRIFPGARHDCDRPPFNIFPCRAGIGRRQRGAVIWRGQLGGDCRRRAAAGARPCRHGPAGRGAKRQCAVGHVLSEHPPGIRRHHRAGLERAPGSVAFANGDGRGGAGRALCRHRRQARSCRGRFEHGHAVDRWRAGRSGGGVWRQRTRTGRRGRFAGIGDQQQGCDAGKNSKSRALHSRIAGNGGRCRRHRRPDQFCWP
jgi:hypothetical protein